MTTAGLPDHIYEFLFMYRGWTKLVTFFLYKIAIYYTAVILLRSELAFQIFGFTEFTIELTLLFLDYLCWLPIMTQSIWATANYCIYGVTIRPVVYYVPVLAHADLVAAENLRRELEERIHDLDFPAHVEDEESSASVSE